MLLGIQIIGILFSFLLSYLAFLHYKKNEFTKTELIYWELACAIFLLIVIFPKTIESISNKLGTIRTMDLLTILAFMLFALFNFKLYVSHKKFQKKLERITRNDALNNINHN